MRWLVLGLLLVSGCAAPEPEPEATSTPVATATPVATPTPIPTLVPTAVPTPAEQTDPAAVGDAFVSEVADLVDEIQAASESDCSELRANPSEVRSLHGFAATLERLAAQPGSDLDSPDMQAAVAELKQVLGELDGALAVCGIPTS